MKNNIEELDLIYANLDLEEINRKIKEIDKEVKKKVTKENK